MAVLTWEVFWQMGIAVFLFAILPGPGWLAILATGARSGFSRACYFLYGEMMGDILYGSLAIFSLEFVARRLEPMMVWVRYFGAAYILWLGISNLRAMAKIKDNDQELATVAETLDRPYQLLISGTIIGITNPKVILFYLTFFPLFVDLRQLSISTGVIIMLVVVASGLCGVMLVAALGSLIGNTIKQPKFKRRMNLISGIILIFVSGYLVLGL